MHNQIIGEGFIECIDHHSTSHSGSHCITHQAVEKDFTTLIPIVFDYSCHQSSNSLCLNDCLLISSPCNGGLVCLKLHCFGISRKCSFMHGFILMIQQTPQMNYSVCTISRLFHKEPPVCRSCSMQWCNTTSGNIAHLYHTMCAQIFTLITSSPDVLWSKMQWTTTQHQDPSWAMPDWTCTAGPPSLLHSQQ